MSRRQDVCHRVRHRQNFIGMKEASFPPFLVGSIGISLPGGDRPDLSSGTIYRYALDALTPDGYTLIGDTLLHDCYVTEQHRARIRLRTPRGGVVLS
ncbi:MAG: hypothetical protein WB992_20140 [Bryobacteraceae bacterium]